MRTLHSIGRDYLAQVAAFGASLADRLIVPGVFLRTLGVTDFSAWGVVLAASSLVSVLDLGVTRYLANKLVGLIEGGSKQDAAILFSEALAIMFVIAILAPLVVIAVGIRGAFATGQPAVDHMLVDLLVPVSMAVSFRMFIALFLVLYRASGSFRVETWAIAVSDLFRTGCAVTALALGADLLQLAWVYAGATFLTSSFYVPLTLRRFREFTWRLRLPGRHTRREAVRVAPGLGLTNGFNIAYTALPTIILGLLQPGAAGLAQFILIRTLGNFARQMVNLFSSVFGLELARRAARRDHAGYVVVFQETSAFLAVQVAVGVAMLLVFGSPMFALWTGRSALFELPILLAAVTPLLLIPNNLLIQEALTYHNLPWLIIQARIAQTFISFVAFLFLPIENVPLRMMSALAAGEVVGLGFLVFFALLRSIPGISMGMFFRPALTAVAICGLSSAILLAVREVLPDRPWPQFIGGALSASIVLALAIVFFGLSASRRRDLQSAAASVLGKLGYRSR